MLPNFRAPAGQTSRQAGYLPGAGALDAPMAFFHHALPARPVAQIRHVRIQPLFGNFRLRPIETAGEIRTGRFAVTATDAPIVIDHRDAIRFLPGGFDRANFDAGGVPALLARNRHVKKPFSGTCAGS